MSSRPGYSQISCDKICLKLLNMKEREFVFHLRLGLLVVLCVVYFLTLVEA